MLKRYLLIASISALWPCAALAQTSINPLPVSDNLTVSNTSIAGDPRQSPSLTIQLEGTWTGTVTFEGRSNESLSYVSVLATSVTDGSTSTTATANGSWVIFNGGYSSVRARFSTPTSGTVIVNLSPGYAQARLASPQFSNVYLSGKVLRYNAVTTAGIGTPAVYGYGDVVAATNVGTASIATYTPAADGTFEVGCNVLVTTSTTHSFSCDVTYTDEGNSARTLILPVAQLAGAFITGGLITNVTGAGPYESATVTIRAKAATAITVRTSAGGTYTTVVYNARGHIKQVG